MAQEFHCAPHKQQETQSEFSIPLCVSFICLFIIMNQKQRLDRHNLIILFLRDLYAGIQLL